jgi:hypothetical protein
LPPNRPTEIARSGYRTTPKMQDHQPSLTELWQPDKLLEISLQNLDRTKKDLEKNWASQMISVGTSIGVILGLGSPISYPAYGNVLCLILPLVNLYLFMRFGGLLSAFSSARFAAEKMVRTYYQKAGLTNYALIPGESEFFRTNSYFEYYHDRITNRGTFAYLLLVPIVLTLSNVTSMYMLMVFFKNTGNTIVGYAIVVLYVAPIIILYWNYYLANKEKPIAYSDKMNFHIGLVFRDLCARYDPARLGSSLWCTFYPGPGSPR